jgi:hypothetical protein
VHRQLLLSGEPSLRHDLLRPRHHMRERTVHSVALIG